MQTVSSYRAEDYGEARMKAAVAAHFERLGLEKDLRDGMRVAIKPNLLAARAPEMAVTTHPDLVQSIVEWLRERGVKDVVVLDSPGGVYNHQTFERIARACGYGGFDCLNEDFSSVKKGPFQILRPIAETDMLINVAKLKTHGLTRMSAGVKNLFGCIPGLAKPEMHVKFPDAESFASMLITLATTVGPVVTVLDAVDCMEGNGPGGGTKRHMGYTLASRNVYALDWEAALLMGRQPEGIPMLRVAKERGLVLPEGIRVEGDGIVPADPPFQEPDATRAVGMLRQLQRLFRAMPRVDKRKCVGCGKCAESCPMHIIRIEGGKAVMEKKKCISCFCCQEMCPMKAISVRRVFKY